MKTETIKFRVSREEAAAIRARAAQSRISVSDLLRQGGTRGQIVDRVAIHELVREINKIGVNLNQLARTANLAGHDSAIYEEGVGIVEQFRDVLYTYTAQGGK